MFKVSKGFFTAALLSATVLASSPVLAENIFGAMSKAYQNNSTLNSDRAGVRVTDEGVAIAKSGYRPTLNATASASLNDTTTARGSFQAGSFGIELNQMLFDGFQTKNSVASAEAQVLASRENLRNSEQTILFDAVSAYMALYLNRQVAVLREKNLEFLNEQLRAAEARFEVGEGTRTDVAQADASRAAAIALLNSARAQVKSSEAIYRRVIGVDASKLETPVAAGKSLPKSINQAYALAEGGHPAIKATQHAVDAAAFNVKVNEGALLPNLGLTAGVERSVDSLSGTFSNDATTATAGVRLNVPIYQGGRVAATVRQSKETLGQRRIAVDEARDAVRAAVASAWAQLEAARASVTANRAAIAAAQLALEGVIEERKVGQRTTLDVLNAQADVLDAQISLAQSEHDSVVASYAVVSAVGRLTARGIGLQVAEHKPEEHYEAVKDKWFGLRTPDAR